MLNAAWMAEPVDPGAGPEELTEAAQLVAVVQTAVRALPPGQQAAAALYYLDGLTCAEVAEHLGTSVGAVKARLHKARATLRRQLAPGWKEQSTMPTTDQIPMRISDVRATEQATERRHVVVLTSDGGTQDLLIWIGSGEALALARTLEGVQLPRPSVYHLTTALLQAAGRRLAEARITALTDQVIYAQTVLDDGTVVDARPSDALNLALLADAPIQVDAAVLRADRRAGHEDPIDYAMDARAILNAAT
jgi:bifunctional DNase/RNase